MEPATFATEENFWLQGKRFVAGLDEVGRGAWAGPLVAAAVVFPAQVVLPKLLFDSKKLTPRKRQNLDRLIRAQALSWAVAGVGAAAIDKFGLSRATEIVFHRAVQRLGTTPDFVLVDGMKRPSFLTLKPDGCLALCHGDRISATIAAASIVAKVYRDRLMVRLAASHPGYGFGQHKGYGTARHRSALKELGPAAIHRRSFANIASLERRWDAGK
jgi:ribonuclease HII